MADEVPEGLDRPETGIGLPSSTGPERSKNEGTEVAFFEAYNVPKKIPI